MEAAKALWQGLGVSCSSLTIASLGDVRPSFSRQQYLFHHFLLSLVSSSFNVTFFGTSDHGL